MPNKARGAVLALMTMGLLIAPIAEAKRAGGGKSSGMSRTQPSSQSQQQNNMNRSSQPAPTQAGAQPQRSGSNVGGMVAAGVAGAAIGAVAMNAMADDETAATTNTATNANTTADTAAEDSGSMGWLWILVLAAIAFFVFRKFKAKKAAVNPYAPNSTGGSVHRQTTQSHTNQTGSPSANTNIFGQPVGGGTPSAPVGGFGGAYMSSGNQLPDGTEPATFLRFARQRFNHIQAMNTAANIEEIRRYFTPEMYQEIYQEITSNHDVAEFSNLLANVVEQTTENGQHVVSVRFTGMVSEDINSPSQPFAEIWHFVKPQGSQDEWLVAGIQQN